MPQYDLTLGGIELPTAQQDFSETIGSEYELVGAVPMPGAPRPRLYNINIPIYGEPDEADPWATGDTKRDQVRSLLDNAETRFEGIQLEADFDTSINAWIVIGTAELSYAEGGPTFGDYMLRIGGAAVIPAQQTLLLHQLSVADRRLTTTPLDPRWRAYRKEPAKGTAKGRHYLPVGAHDVLGQTDPQLPDLHTYRTIWGEGIYVDERVHGETLSFEQDWDAVGHGDVRIFQANENRPEQHEDLLRPGNVGWLQVYGPNWRPWTDVPVLENGVCRVRHLGEGKFTVEGVRRNGYEGTHSFTVGHPRLLGAKVVSWSVERAEIKASFAGKSSRAEVHITLQRGWPGPAIDVYHVGDRSRRLSVDGDGHAEEDGDWQHVRLGASSQEALAGTRARRRLRTR